jgi:hypothetical protein
MSARNASDEEKTVMTKPIVAVLVAAALAVGSASLLAAQRHPSDEGQQTGRRAEPRPDGPSREGQPRQAEPRRESTPPHRESEPARHAPPRPSPPEHRDRSRIYLFSPVSLERGFYYHPYFGFYYGPYYGPFDQYPAPNSVVFRYRAAAVRLRVKPVEAEVYVNGYYAGLVDDFDGIFQRLYLPAGSHTIAFRLDGYRVFETKIYVTPGDTRDVTHLMVPLGAGESSSMSPQPGRVQEEWTFGGTTTTESERAASPFGILGLRIDPADAQIVVDGEVWTGTSADTELVVHVAAGWHRIEVRKAGFQTFKTELELSAGATTRMNVTLMP